MFGLYTFFKYNVCHVPALLRWWGKVCNIFRLFTDFSSAKPSLNSAFNPTIAKRVLATGFPVYILKESSF